MTDDPARWGPGWDVEPCDTAEPPPVTRSRQGNHPYANVPDDPRAYRTTKTVEIKGDLL